MQATGAQSCVAVPDGGVSESHTLMLRLTPEKPTNEADTLLQQNVLARDLT